MIIKVTQLTVAFLFLNNPNRWYDMLNMLIHNCHNLKRTLFHFFGKLKKMHGPIKKGVNLAPRKIISLR